MKGYKDKKEKGLIEVIEAGGGHALRVRRFSQEDGSEIEPEVIAIDLNAMKTEKDNLERAMEDYIELIEDIEKV